MITSTLIDATRTLTVPGDAIFVSTDNGTSGGTGQQSAITTIALCNIGAPTLTDETVNAAVVNIWFCKQGVGYQDYNRIVSNLTIPAGETVFFSEERIILEADDEIYVGADTADLIAVTVSSLPV
jgi:hypothetical protein